VGVTVELTYDMGKALGAHRFEIEDAATLADVVAEARRRFGDRGEEFERLTSRAALSVNGVLSSYRKGLRTKLEDGDTVAFVKAAAGG
jgi:molybdopterin converting factor small subunit